MLWQTVDGYEEDRLGRRVEGACCAEGGQGRRCQEAQEGRECRLCRKSLTDGERGDCKEPRPGTGYGLSLTVVQRWHRSARPDAT